VQRNVPLCLCLLVLCLTLPSPAAAQEIEPAPIVTDGLAAYQRAGGDSAVSVWTRGWEATDSAKVTVLKDNLAAMEQTFGKMQGFEVLHTFTLSRRVRRSYAVIWVVVRPVFVFFQAYQAPEGDWRVLDLTWNTNWKEVFPATLVDR
jgi:hypothetical protein